MRCTYAELFQHVIRIYLDTTHIELDRTDMLVDLALVIHGRHLQLGGFLSRAVLLVICLELFKKLDLLHEESLRVRSFDLNFCAVGGAGVGDRRVPFRVLDGLFKDRHRTRAVVGFCVLVLRSCRLVEWFGGILNLDRPGG